MLTLPIKKKWFDMIRSEEKKEEYREIKPYYEKRFQKVWGEHAYVDSWGKPIYWGEQKIRLRNGYSSDSPAIITTCTLSKKQGKPEWGAEPGKRYFVLTILEVEDET